MKITLLQTDIEWAAHVANRQRAEEMIAAAEPSELYVLPEMFATGFVTRPEGVAEDCSAEGVCETLEWMRIVAKRHDAAVAGSVAVRTADGSFRNRFYFVMPDGTFRYYDKRHLFTYGGEHRTYSPGGEEQVVVEWRGMRFLLMVCYDLRFPVFSRNGLVDSDAMTARYDCALYVANWPQSRRKVWDALLRARALENQCFVAGVNRVGDDEACHYDGGTVLVDAYGKTISSAADSIECAITAELDMERLKGFREKFPVLADAD